MTNGEEKKKSGCGKWLGCGCLVLVLIGAGLGITGWFFAKKFKAPGEAHAGHFIPETAPGWGQMNLQKADEGMSDLHRFIMTEIQENQPEQEGIAGMLQGMFSSSPSGKPAPIGPQLTGWSLPNDEGPSKGALIVDLNTMSTLTATTLRMTLSTFMATEAAPLDVGGISIYVNPNGYSYLSHKGFIVISENTDMLEAAAESYLASKENGWTGADAFINEQDIRIQWTGNFENFNMFTTDMLGIANPKDGDFESPAKGLENIDLEADIVSADKIQFVLHAKTETKEDARRVQADLEQHAGEIQQKLSGENLAFTYSSETDGQTAVLTADLTGLREWISNRIAQMFSSEQPEKPVPTPPAS